MKTASSNKKVRELINMVVDGTLIPRPEFQRRLIWTKEDKNNFLDTVISGYPFPEIYLADGEVDLDSGKGTQQLVDGQQRVSTLVQYFNADPELKLTTVVPYKNLSEDEKRAFLQYDVSVRDLGAITKEQTIEIFRRINATKYSLEDIEINNAVYNGKLKKFAQKISERNFFIDHQVFNAADYKRMGDLRFALSIIAVMIMGYSNRDDELEDLLRRYNDEFGVENDLDERIQRIIEFIEECGFDKNSRIWKKADLYSAFSELDRLINIEKIQLQPLEVINRLINFYNRVDNLKNEYNRVCEIYYKSALQASNDKSNRCRRGIIMNDILVGQDDTIIIDELEKYGFI